MALLLPHTFAFSCLPRGFRALTGADPEVEEDGGEGRAHIEWVWCGHAARAARRIFLCERITHSILGGSGGMLL